MFKNSKISKPKYLLYLVQFFSASRLFCKFVMYRLHLYFRWKKITKMLFYKINVLFF